MNALSKSRHNAGFSLIEFMVGITMTTIIFIVATNLVIGVLSINAKSQRSQDIEQAKHDITSELTGALQWGSPISVTGGVLTVGMDTYRVVNKSFQKNGIAYTNDKVLVTKFDIERVASDDGLVSFDVHIDFEHRDSSSIKDSLALFISARIP